jgi:hypothetical protein
LSYKLLRDARLYRILLRIDREIAGETRSGGCVCGGRLHSATYPRQAGCGRDLTKLDPAHGRRFSFCCANDGCRKRATPPSVRFLGRRVYLGPVVVLIAAMAEGVTPARLRRLCRLAGDVSLKTVERWLRWWREAFPVTQVWKEAKARFVPVVETSRLPASLLDRFGDPDRCVGLVAVLELLAPLTTTSNSRD